MSKASDIWNDLPFEKRRKLLGSQLERQILDYKLEIDRAERAYKKHIREVKEHLANVERGYREWEREMEASDG